VTVGWEDVEDWAGIFVTFEDGSIAQLTCTDTRLGGIRNYLTAHGSRAVASANINPNTMCQAFTPDGSYFAESTSSRRHRPRKAGLSRLQMRTR